ncbi:MAG: hypothetical protein J6A75_03345 [Lachnospiraceae bacterium]|nr:hypothetical protein [Lachnospiraceae bacterium]
MAEKLHFYICSPLSAPTQKGIEANMNKARIYVKTVCCITGKRAIAPHAILPGYFDDNIPEERELCLQFGLDVLALCKVMVVCGTRVSRGMKGEIERAKCLNMPIYALCFKGGEDSYENYELVPFEEVKEEFDYV